MTSDRFFSKSTRSDMKRDIPYFIIYSCLFFFSIVVLYILQVENTLSGYVDTGWTVQKIREAAANDILICAISTLGLSKNAIVLILLGFAEAYHQFGFLHRKRELDFVHSMPQKRKSIFASRYLGGVILVMVPFVIFIAVGTMAALVTGANAAKLIPAVLTASGLNVLIFLLTYSVCIIAVMLTGRAFTGISGMAVLAAFFPMLGLILDSIPQSWFRTYVSGSQIGFGDVLQWISPYGFVRYWTSMYGGMYSTGNESALSLSLRNAQVLSIVIAIAAIAGLVLLAFLLYKKHPLESAGEAMAFKKTEAPIRAALEAAGGLGFMQFFFDLHSSFGWAIFGMVAGILIVHLVVQLIYRKEVKAMLAAPVQLAVTLLAGVLVAGALNFDWFGYDSYIPDADDIESAYIDNGIDLGTLQIYGEDKGSADYWYLTEIDTSRYVQTESVSSDEDKETVLEVAREGIANVNAMSRRGGLSMLVKNITYASSYNADDETRAVTITYKLKSGKTVKRNYDVNADLADSAYEAIYERNNMKELTDPILSLENMNVKSLGYFENGVTKSLSDEETTRNAILDAIRTDTDGLTVEQMKAAYPVGILKVYIDEDAYEYLTGQDYPYGENINYYIGCPIYATFENTIAEMAKAGINIGEVSDEGFEDVTVAYQIYKEEEENSSVGMSSYIEASGYIEGNDIETVKENYVSDRTRMFDPFGPDTMANYFWLYVTSTDSDEDSSGESGTLIINEDTEKLYEKCVGNGM